MPKYMQNIWALGSLPDLRAPVICTGFTRLVGTGSVGRRGKNFLKL